MLAPSSTYYFAEVIRGAHEAAAKAGARLILRISDYRPQEDHARTEGLLSAGAEGLLVAPGWQDPGDPAAFGDWITSLPVPTVLLERRPTAGSPLDGLDRVCSDHAHGVLLAVRHLVDLEHGAPLLMARADSPTAVAVRSGYQEALSVLGLRAPQDVIDSVPAELAPDAFEEAVQALREAVLSGVATAALIHNDVDAIQVVQRLAELGVRVPQDLALIAYDDEVAALADTPLTAVAPPKREVGPTRHGTAGGTAGAERGRSPAPSDAAAAAEGQGLVRGAPPVGDRASPAGVRAPPIRRPGGFRARFRRVSHVRP